MLAVRTLLQLGHAAICLEHAASSTYGSGVCGCCLVPCFAAHYTNALSSDTDITFDFFVAR